MKIAMTKANWVDPEFSTKTYFDKWPDMIGGGSFRAYGKKR